MYIYIYIIVIYDSDIYYIRFGLISLMLHLLWSMPYAVRPMPLACGLISSVHALCATSNGQSPLASIPSLLVSSPLPIVHCLLSTTLANRLCTAHILCR